MKFNDLKDINKKIPAPGSFKHYHQMAENGGRVVKGVNTTPDVGPNEIKTQAAKFGNSVDKDGRPPTLSKKVKGSKTNVLFNLGMAESVEERSLTKGEEKKKEKYVKGMKKAKGDFKDRYGDDAEAVMYATATKMAKKESKDTRIVKPRDPNAQTMTDLRKSGAMGAHKDKKKLAKQGYSKHKGKVDEAKELASVSEIFVDMDGVLVDFFGAWTKMMGVSDWKQIKNVDQALQKIRDKDDFWLTLKPTKNAGKLLAIIKKIKGEYNILSAPLAGDPKAEPHKREWIAKYLKVFPPKKVIITADKQKYATQPDGTPNILIDDFGQNVAKWEGAGGVGFKHKDHKFERTATKLADYISPERNEEIAEILGFTTRTPKRATKTVKRRPPEEDSVQDKLKKRRALASKVGVDKAFRSDAKLEYYVAEIAPGTIYLSSALDEGSLSVRSSDLKDFVKRMLDDLDPKSDTKKMADIARMLGKEVYYKGDRIVIQDPDFDFNKDKDTNEGDLIPQPKNTFLTKADTAYDHYKIGTNLANLKAVPKGANYDEPDVVIAPYAGEKEMKYLMKQLKRIGYDVQDASGYKDGQFDEGLVYATKRTV